MRDALRALRRRPLRIVLALALLNLGWDLWSWHGREAAEGERRFFRRAEQAQDIDRGLAEISIVNETDQSLLIESLTLDGDPGAALAERRSLMPAGQTGADRQEERRLDHLVAVGQLVLDAGDGSRRIVSFEVDRRRPNSCRVVLRIRDADEMVSDCEPLFRIRTAFRWLFGPPSY